MAQVARELERREMFAEIKKLCEPDNVTNFITIGREYLILALTVGGCTWAYHQFVEHNWSLWGMLPIYAMSVFIIGAWVQNRLSVLVHEASHYSLFKNKVLNDVMANLFLLFPVFGAIKNYRVGHWGHHRHVNDPDNDPDLQRLTKHQARDFPVPKGRFYRQYVLAQIMLHKAVSYLKGRALYVAIPMKADAVKGQDVLGLKVVWAMRIAYYLPLAAAATYFGLWPHFLLFWVVPLLSFYPAVLFLREIAHHGNYPDNGDFTNSRVYLGKWLEREIFFPFGEHNHVLHHMFPTIPHKRMPDAHQVMLNYPPYRDTVVTCNGFFMKADPNSADPTVLDILAAPPERYLRNYTPGTVVGEIRRSTSAEVGADVEPVAH